MSKCLNNISFQVIDYRTLEEAEERNVSKISVEAAKINVAVPMLQQSLLALAHLPQQVRHVSDPPFRRLGVPESVVEHIKSQ